MADPAPGGEAARILSPDLVGRLGRLRLTGRRRVAGRYAGQHPSPRHGSSLDFADHRPYVAGDDPRRVDRHASARLGRLLVKLFEAEDEMALRVVVDRSASMGFGAKAQRAREVAAGLAAVACGGGDRVRVVLAGEGVEPGPWYRGTAGLPALEGRLAAARPAGAADLPTALHAARSGAPRGLLVLVSDLLTPEWPAAVDALAAGGGDAVLVHLLGRADLDPALEGDLRLVDAETGEEREVSLTPRALAEHARARDAWLAAVGDRCRARAVAVVRVVDDEPVEDLLLVALTRLGIVA